jgi:hypothetical protein
MESKEKLPTISTHLVPLALASYVYPMEEEMPRLKYT